MYLLHCEEYFLVGFEMMTMKSIATSGSTGGRISVFFFPRAIVFIFLFVQVQIQIKPWYYDSGGNDTIPKAFALSQFSLTKTQQISTARRNNDDRPLACSCFNSLKQASKHQN